MNTRLFIEGQEIELDKSVEFAITKQFEDLSDPTKIINDWSKSVSIPFTIKNNKTFGYIYRVDRLITTPENGYTGGLIGMYFDPLKKLDFRLEYNSHVIMVGYAKMTDVKQVSGKGTYQITLFGELGKVFQEMKKITFDTTTEEPEYLIHGEDYVAEYINKELVYDSWTTAAQEHLTLYPRKYTVPGGAEINHPAYNVTDIIGFAPNNSFNNEFDSSSIQRGEKYSSSFKDILSDSFEAVTGVNIDSVLSEGLLPREIGEYRSYYQLPFVFWNKLFQMFQYKAEEVTGYTFELDSSWFNEHNPYWTNLVYILKQLDINKQEGSTNYYNAQSWHWTWQGDTRTSMNVWDVVIPTTTETFPFVQEFELRPTVLEVGNDYSVKVKYVLGMELMDEGSSDPYSLRINKDNALNISVFLYKSDGTTLVQQDDFLICDNEYTGDTSSYKLSNVLKYGELIREGTYPNRKKYIKISPIVEYILQNYYSAEYIIKLGANWVSDTYRFMTKFTESDDYTFGNPYTVLEQTNQSLLSAQKDISKRTNTYFIFNDLWDNSVNIFTEIIRYCKQYRILISVDELSKKIYFKTYKTFFSNLGTDEILDWTDKIDKSKDFIITPVTWENKYILFNYVDLDSTLSNDYKEKYGVNFGEYKLATDYNFNNSVKNLFEGAKQSIINTDNVLSWIKLKQNEIIFSFPNELFIYNKDNDKKPIDLFGSMFFHNGLYNFTQEEQLYLSAPYISDDSSFQAKTNKYFYNITSPLYVSTYPYLDIIRTNTNNSEEKYLSIFNTPSENYTYLNNYADSKGIYNLFWETYLNERYNVQNKKITCYVNFSVIDFNNFKWNTLIKIDNQICIPNKIYDYNIGRDVTTKMEFITVQDISAYSENDFINELEAQQTEES